MYRNVPRNAYANCDNYRRCDEYSFLQISNLIEAVSLLSGVKLDPATLKHDASKMPTIPPHPKSAASSVTETRTPSAKTRVTSSSMRHVKTPATLKTYEMPIQPLVGLNTSFLMEKTWWKFMLKSHNWFHISLLKNNTKSISHWSSNMQLMWISIV